jgi:macrolide-specific efflux system membrane fusion protein
VKQSTLLLAQEQRDRNETLASAGIISASDRDITRAGFKAAAADAAALTAQMKEASAAVSTAKSNLAFTRITAPMAGEVVSISLLEGQTLNANQSAPNILRIADLSTVTVWAQVSEADISRVKVDQAVYFTVLGQTRRWDGKVRQILPTPELIANVVFFDVLLDIPNADRALKIQMTAQVFIVLSQAKGVLLLPASAVGNAAEGSQVKVRVLEDDGKLQSRLVTLGIKSELYAEVKSGLVEGERVVTAGPKAPAASASPLNTRKGP